MRIHQPGHRRFVRAQRSQRFRSFAGVKIFGILVFLAGGCAQAATQHSGWAGVKEARLREQFPDFP